MNRPPCWPPTIRRLRPERLLALAGLAAAVLATHLWLLRQRAAPRPVARVTVTLPRPAASALPIMAVPLTRPDRPWHPPRPAATALAAASTPTVEARRRQPAVTAMNTPTPAASSPASTAPEASAADSARATAGGNDGGNGREGARLALACLAADRTALPPPVEARYSLQRGRLRGEGRLSWHHDGQHYRLSLEAQLPLTGTLLRQTSEGGFDRCGLAPLRHTDKRLGRSERALSVLRPPPGSPAADAGEAGELRFSGRSVARALEPGTQDRLSWLVQLALRLAAAAEDPGADTPGRWPIEIAVAAVNGDVQRWVFTRLGREPDGLLHLQREPGGPYETHAEVWVDPQRGHWPVRIQLSEARGEPLLLHLVDWRPGGP